MSESTRRSLYFLIDHLRAFLTKVRSSTAAQPNGYCSGPKQPKYERGECAAFRRSNGKQVDRANSTDFTTGELRRPQSFERRTPTTFEFTHSAWWAELDHLNPQLTGPPLVAPRPRSSGPFCFLETYMKSLEDFFFEKYGPSSPSTAFTSLTGNRSSTLPEEVRQAANRGWHVFPVSPLAKFTAQPNLLISEATSDICRLEEFAAEYPLCGWRVAIGPSSLCILQLDGQVGKNSFAALSADQGECLTLQAHLGDTAWAFFRWPTGLVLRTSGTKLAPGMRILREGESCIIPPSSNCVYLNPWADIDAIPSWLRELAFETPDSPPGNAVPVPAFSPRPVPCRSKAHFATHRGARKGYPAYPTGLRGGFPRRR